MDDQKSLNKFYIVRWYDSKYYTSVNTVEYVFDIFSKTRPEFYKFLVYELIETSLTFREITLKLPFDASLTRVSVNRLHSLEKAKFRYHLKKLREYLDNPTS